MRLKSRIFLMVLTKKSRIQSKESSVERPLGLRGVREGSLIAVDISGDTLREWSQTIKSYLFEILAHRQSMAVMRHMKK